MKSTYTFLLCSLLLSSGCNLIAMDLSSDDARAQIATAKKDTQEAKKELAAMTKERTPTLLDPAARLEAAQLEALIAVQESQLRLFQRALEVLDLLEAKTTDKVNVTEEEDDDWAVLTKQENE